MTGRTTRQGCANNVLLCLRAQAHADERALRDRSWHGAPTGAWGSGPFDNDDASDFAGDVSSTSDTDQIAAQLQDALTTVTKVEGYVEAPEMSCALAAAAIVAMSADAALPAPTSLDPSWLASVRAARLDQLWGLAARVFARALVPEDNEWYELWAEAELVDEVRDHLAPYSAALA